MIIFLLILLGLISYSVLGFIVILYLDDLTVGLIDVYKSYTVLVFLLGLIFPLVFLYIGIREVSVAIYRHLIIHKFE